MFDPENERILVVEDECHIAEGLRLNLELQGYKVALAETGTSGLALWKQWRPHLIVLDVMLPGIDGVSVLKRIRLEDERLPILILSAKNSAQDRIEGFNHGVDDYLSKPFNLEEFLLRVERLLKQSSWQDNSIDAASGSQDPYSFGSNKIDFLQSVAYCKGQQISLTEQELRLLRLLINNRGKALSRGEILEVAWGFSKDLSTRTVDNFIVRFRKYFEDDPKNPEFFKSRRSVGYVFDH
ncbi:DNA-binding response regulator [Oleiphilus sp. HI0081]|nr:MULTISPECIES: response regulator transcription factor [unclassified Oleiphilus]KZY43037.1 DNA-binding response regulator [Oleiphilus sp. HI0050]KZY77883.1 DNA-binding response regulator [Oleiphilus sp. HI0069]KZY82130.1 DNA-binding response regulator [Oleiphilus sp. HI0068]KZY87984.1 DNA-binding response regulator [Oleiphilus sp. HI0072]KZZ19261.1 DNA-binding response regulator [Oleiphilus sp. HI0078]KZZ29737.1 DNA-binding response regulator [Oleiphilus sp. HI0081]